MVGLNSDASVRRLKGKERPIQSEQARAEVLSADERASIWPRITAKFPNFGEYQQKTTRVIPVVRLARAS